MSYPANILWHFIFICLQYGLCTYFHHNPWQTFFHHHNFSVAISNYMDAHSISSGWQLSELIFSLILKEGTKAKGGLKAEWKYPNEKCTFCCQCPLHCIALHCCLFRVQVSLMSVQLTSCRFSKKEVGLMYISYLYFQLICVSVKTLEKSDFFKNILS